MSEKDRIAPLWTSTEHFCFPLCNNQSKCMMQQLRRFVKEKEAFRHRMPKQRGGKSQIRSEPARWAVRSSDQENDSCCCNKRPDDNATGLQSSLICASRRHDVARSRRCESFFCRRRRRRRPRIPNVCFQSTRSCLQK